jgi:hypothetical protein
MSSWRLLVTAIHADGRCVVRQVDGGKANSGFYGGRLQLLGLCCGMATWMTVTSMAVTQTALGASNERDLIVNNAMRAKYFF